MEQMRKQLLIIDDSLKDYGGHWYEYDKAVTEINEKVGVEVTIAAHKKIRKHIFEKSRVLPIFRKSNWENNLKLPSFLPSIFKRSVEVFFHNWTTYHDIDKFLESSQPFDCIFVPTVLLPHLLAWVILIRKYQGNKFKRIILFFRFNLGKYNSNCIEPTFPNYTFFVKKSIQNLHNFITSGIVCMATDSYRLSREYKLLCGVDFAVFPSPRIKQPIERQERRLSQQPVVFSCLGPARFEKGIDIFQKAIIFLLNTKKELNLQFIIQLNPTQDIFNLELNSELHNQKKVLVVTDYLSSEEYDKYFFQTDCMVLPYRRKYYYARISGIAVEAATAGIPIIYTQDTWIEDAVSQYGSGIGFENENYLDLAEKISIMTSKIAEYKTEAIKRAELAQEYHSPHNFLKSLWGNFTDFD